MTPPNRDPAIISDQMWAGSDRPPNAGYSSTLVTGRTGAWNECVAL